MDNRKFEQLIDLIINENEEQAKALFHDIVVEKSREIYESMMDDEDMTEGMGGQVGDLLDEINIEEEGMTEEDEELEFDDIEGDGDDDKTFVFRAVSRMNRQGTNIFSDGSVSIGSMQKINNATFGVYHRHPVNDAVSINVPSLQFEDSVINIDVDATPSSIWSALSVSANKENVFKVDGNGSAYSAGEFYSNSRGYAEMFEWADKNNRNEERVGFTVAFDSTGKIISADEGDNVIGVVVNSAAFVGNTAWNHWQGKKLKNSLDSTATTEFHVIEWLEMETSLLKSFDKTTLSSSFIMPENAAEIQSDSNGDSFVKTTNSAGYDSNKNYVSRINRSSWEIVCVLGVAPVYKGQQTGKNWVKIKSLNDELELWLIR